jgi:hypothetical protein
MARFLTLIERAVVLVSMVSACSTSPGPLGSCPSGCTQTRCVSRVDAWNAVPVDDSSVSDAGQTPAGCPSTELVGPEGLSKLGMSGYRFDGEPTYDAGADTCCYKSVGSSC